MFQLRQSFLLFLTATIWGSGFVAQSIGMDHVTPFTYTFFRTFLGAVVLLPVLYLVHRRLQKQRARMAAGSAANSASSTKDAVEVSGFNNIPHNKRRHLILGSFCCGFCLVGVESFQQFGLVTTDAGKAGFITSMYIIFVPLIGLFIGKKLNANIVIGVILLVFGLL